MPWKECNAMDERLRFIARLLGGGKMAPLGREFGISRVTGYKIYERYKECGLDGLSDRRRRPYRQANKLPFQIERCILGLKREHPSWSAPKIRDKLLREFSMIKPPAVSTVHAALDRHGLVTRRKRRRRSERAMVRRLQGRVQARRQALLLSADDHRLPISISLGLRRHGVDESGLCLRRV